MTTSPRVEISITNRLISSMSRLSLLACQVTDRDVIMMLVYKAIMLFFEGKEIYPWFTFSKGRKMMGRVKVIPGLRIIGCGKIAMKNNVEGGLGEKTK